MSDVKELKKLSRDRLNELAVQNGISDAADESKYETKNDLAEALAPKVTPEALNEFNQGTKSGDEGQDQGEDSQEQPQTPANPVNTPPPIDSPEDVDDRSGTEPAPGADEEDDEEEDEPTPRTTRGSRQTNSEEGMGFPRKNGKTISIFSNKPHETVRNVAGVMVPLTLEEAVGDSTKDIKPKTDAEIIEKLKKLGKL